MIRSNNWCISGRISNNDEIQRTYIAENYPIAWQLLVERYEHPQIIKETLSNQLRELRTSLAGQHIQVTHSHRPGLRTVHRTDYRPNHTRAKMCRQGSIEQYSAVPVLLQNVHAPHHRIKSDWIAI